MIAGIGSRETLPTELLIPGDSPFLGKRAVVGGVPGPYVWQSYQECYELAKNFG